jgi:hypothetical protein
MLDFVQIEEKIVVERSRETEKHRLVLAFIKVAGSWLIHKRASPVTHQQVVLRPIPMLIFHKQASPTTD